MNIEKLNCEIISCRKCTRLVEYRSSRSPRAGFAGEIYWNKPITGYGSIAGRVLIVGLAPAFDGGNRTGRIFTGDKSSDFLISSLYAAGLANMPTSERKDDGLEYIDTYITLALKCAPPDNKPAKEELNHCSGFFEKEIEQMENLKAILCLGKIAFDSTLKFFRAHQINTRGIKFIHGKYYNIGGVRLYCSYHPSPRNVNTGLLRKEEFISLLKKIRNFVG